MRQSVSQSVGQSVGRSFVHLWERYGGGTGRAEEEGRQDRTVAVAVVKKEGGREGKGRLKVLWIG